MEKIRPWCGKPSDRGRLRNRTSFGEMWPRNHKALRNSYGKTRAGIAQFDLDRTLDRQLQWSIALLGTRSSRVSVYSIGVKIWQQIVRRRSALNSVELSSLPYGTLLYVDSSASVLWQATQSQTSAFASAARPRCATLSVRRVGGRVKPVMPPASHVKGTPLPVLYRERKCAKNYNE